MTLVVKKMSERKLREFKAPRTRREGEDTRVP